MDTQKNNFKKEFLEKLDLKKLESHRLPKTIVISFIASIGSGKSTISEKLSNKLKIPIFDNDGIRRFLNEKGYKDTSLLQDFVLDIALTRMKIVLEKGISYILDADLTLTSGEDMQRISSMGAKLLLVKVNCPEDITLRRIDTRQKDETTSFAGEKEYFERQKLREKAEVNPEYIFFEIDNSKDLDTQVDNLVSKIKTFENE